MITELIMKYVYFKKNINRNKSSFVPIIKEDFLKILIHELLGVFFFNLDPRGLGKRDKYFVEKFLKIKFLK